MYGRVDELANVCMSDEVDGKAGALINYVQNSRMADSWQSHFLSPTEVQINFVHTRCY